MSVNFVSASAQRVNIPAAADINNLVNFTYSCWVRTSATLLTGFLGKGPNIGIYRNGTNFRLGIQFTAGGQRNWRSSSPVIASGTWYHVLVTYNNAGGNPPPAPIFYVNGIRTVGISVGTGNGSPLSDAASALSVGGIDFGGIADWQGRLTDMRLYNRILTDEEAFTIYESEGIDGIVEGLVRRYPLREGPPGATVTAPRDLTGNSVAAVANAPVYDDLQDRVHYLRRTR